ncbi:MAG: hypothetical protein ACRDKB_12480 [Actinomycetota bacterium]
MSSVPAREPVPQPRRRADATRAEPHGPTLRVVTSPPELYPSLVEAIRVVWRNRYAALSSSEVVERGRETGARL